MTLGQILYFGGGYTLTGFFVLIMGWRDFRKQREFLRQTVRTTGIIMGAQLASGRFDDIVSHSPTIRFKTSGGEEVTFTSNFASTQSWKVGESVSIRYRPEQPQVAELDTFLSRWLTVCLCCVIGLAFLGGGILVFFFQGGQEG